MKDIIGYICATILGICLLIVDGDVAVAYSIACGCTMIGINQIQIGKADGSDVPYT